jgi:hypothetical protein
MQDGTDLGVPDLGSSGRRFGRFDDRLSDPLGSSLGTQEFGTQSFGSGSTFGSSRFGSGTGSQFGGTSQFGGSGGLGGRSGGMSR